MHNNVAVLKMKSKPPQKHKVFLLGVLAGMASMVMLWLIIFTSLNNGAKFLAFILCAVFGFVLQIYALKDLKKPDHNQDYSSADLLQEIRNYKWFGIFLSGAFSPYLLSFFIYIVVKNL